MFRSFKEYLWSEIFKVRGKYFRGNRMVMFIRKEREVMRVCVYKKIRGIRGLKVFEDYY